MGKSDADGTGMVIDVPRLSGTDEQFDRWESRRTWMSVIDVRWQDELD
jgi:hypothetical protein